ncbi:hypothetical protein ACFFGH_31010 [Lysobacter korlensis]|uniref:Lipoprotein n=1 Tax=Lysobacter korlensis TaxID=553636 RepID=A0ABV6RZ73_9GAMM
MTPRRTYRAWALAGTLVFSSGALTGCMSGGCPGWHDYSDPEERFRDSALVVVGTAAPAGWWAELFADDAVYDITVERVVKGDVGEDDVVRVESISDHCAAVPFPDGDPLDTDDLVLVFLMEKQDGGLRTLTPFDAVTPVESADELPFDVPAGL